MDRLLLRNRERILGLRRTFGFVLSGKVVREVVERSYSGGVNGYNVLSAPSVNNFAGGVVIMLGMRGDDPVCRRRR